MTKQQNQMSRINEADDIRSGSAWTCTVQKCLLDLTIR